MKPGFDKEEDKKTRKLRATELKTGHVRQKASSWGPADVAHGPLLCA